MLKITCIWTETVSHTRERIEKIALASKEMFWKKYSYQNKIYKTFTDERFLQYLGCWASFCPIFGAKFNIIANWPIKNFLMTFMVLTFIISCLKQTLILILKIKNWYSFNFKFWVVFYGPAFSVPLPNISRKIFLLN